MKKQFKVTTLILQALTSPSYSYDRKGIGNYGPLVPNGHEVLKNILYTYVQEELKIKDSYWYFANKAMTKESLSKAFDALQEIYPGLKIRTGRSVVMNNHDDPSANVKVSVVKALIFATFVTKDELFNDLLREIKRNLDTAESPSFRLSKIINEDSKGESKIHQFISRQVDTTGPKPFYTTLLDYRDVNTTGTGFSRNEALDDACKKWFEKSKIEP